MQGELLILPPWLSAFALPDAKEGSASHAPARRSAFHSSPDNGLASGMRAPASKRRTSRDGTTSLLHLALPGVSSLTAETALPMNMSAGRSAAHVGEPGVERPGDAAAGVCALEQWWAFGSGIAVYDLSQV